MSGGIFGNEAIAEAAPPAHVLAGLALFPVVYSLPVALATAEMATALPEDPQRADSRAHSTGDENAVSGPGGEAALSSPLVTGWRHPCRRWCGREALGKVALVEVALAA